MPTDAVYNPQLPSAPMSSTSSSEVRPNSPWSGNVSASGDTGTSWSALSAGLVAGALAGAALGLMFAPAPGADVRRSIRRAASDSGQRLSRVVGNGRAMAGDAVHRASELIEQGRHAFGSGRAGAASIAPESAPLSSDMSRSGPQPLTASVAEISDVDRRFEEPLGG